MKTEKKTHELFQILLDAMPEDFKDEKTGARGDYCSLNRYATLEIIRYSPDPPEGVTLMLATVPGKKPTRARTYKVRKDGTLNVHKIIGNVLDLTREIREVNQQRADAQNKANEEHRRRIREGKAQVETLLKLVKPTNCYSLREDRGLIGGVYIDVGGENYNDNILWLRDSNRISGCVPIENITAERLNRILEILSEDE